ncbi:hypothetical protein GCM10029964_076510 [Kibdelosporangium lantanae]
MLRKAVPLGVLALGVAGMVVFGGGGQPAQSVRLLSGSAWLPSPKVGQMTLLDGSSSEVVAQVQVAPPGSNLDVVQNGPNAYAINRSTGTIQRIDGATYQVSEPVEPVEGARAGLTAFTAPNAVYVIDTQRGALVAADPRTLKPKGDGLVSLSARLTPAPPRSTTTAACG